MLVAVAREKATRRQAAELDRMLGDRSIDEAGVTGFRQLLADTGALAECEAMIERYVTEALAALDEAPVTAAARAALAELAITATRPHSAIRAARGHAAVRAHRAGA